MSRLTLKQLKAEIEELRAEVERLKNKDKYPWWEEKKREKCPCCGKTKSEPYRPYPYYHCGEY